MFEYIPEYVPAITVFFDIDPGQKGDFHQPHIEPEVEIIKVEVNGTRDEWLEEHLIEAHCDRWVSEILTLMERRAA